jgi:putative mycofactocin binding protein MftB
MNQTESSRYVLASGTQVREEDFGLLFYTMKGPRLYFLSSGASLDVAFFRGEHTLEKCLRTENEAESISQDRLEKIKKVLSRLVEKGVIIER